MSERMKDTSLKYMHLKIWMYNHDISFSESAPVSDRVDHVTFNWSALKKHFMTQQLGSLIVHSLVFENRVWKM